MDHPADAHPVLEDYRPVDLETGEPLKGDLSTETRSLFARHLIAWHVRNYVRSTHLSLINVSKTDAKKIELALLWRDGRWRLEQYNYDDSAILTEIMEQWRGDLLHPDRASQQRMMAEWLRLLNNTTRIRREAADYLQSEHLKSVSFLATFDRNENGRFLLAGRCFQVVPPEIEGMPATLAEVRNRWDHFLLRDIEEDARIATEEEWERDGHQVIDYLRSLFPAYDAKDENGQLLSWMMPDGSGWGCQYGNHAVEVLQMVLGKGFVEMDLRELLLMTGIGNNGKSVLIEILEMALRNPRTLEGIIKTTTRKVYMRSKADVDIRQLGKRAEMVGYRFALVKELDSNMLDMDFIKPYTSGEEVDVGGMRLNDRQACMQQQGMGASNFPPRMAARSEGDERRLMILPFLVDFKDAPAKQTRAALKARHRKLRHLWLFFILQGVRKLIGAYQSKPPETLPAPLEAERQEIIMRGKDSVESDLLRLLRRARPGEKAGHVLIGGGTHTAGIEVSKGRRLYGVMLVVAILCNRNGKRLSDWPKDRVLRILQGKSYRKASGNRNWFLNMQHTAGLEQLLLEETEAGENPVQYLYDREGLKPAPPAAGAEEPAPAPAGDEDAPW